MLNRFVMSLGLALSPAFLFAESTISTNPSDYTINDLTRQDTQYPIIDKERTYFKVDTSGFSDGAILAIRAEGEIERYRQPNAPSVDLYLAKGYVPNPEKTDCSKWTDEFTATRPDDLDGRTPFRIFQTCYVKFNQGDDIYASVVGSTEGAHWSYNNPHFTVSVKEINMNEVPFNYSFVFSAGDTYNIDMFTYVNGLYTGTKCGFQWGKVLNTGHAGERNAKWDCVTSNGADPLKLRITSVFYHPQTFTKEVHGYLSSNVAGGLEWDSRLQQGERNAKFDPNTQGDLVKIVFGLNDRKTKVYTNNTCGLQWSGNIINNNERNAKWDCNNAPDPVAIEFK